MAPASPRSVCGRFVVAGVACLAAASVLSGCRGSRPPRPSLVGGLVALDRPGALQADGVIPFADPGVACGSRTATFGQELARTPPAQAVVTDEWGEIVPGVAMRATGTARTVAFSSGDLPFTHPFGRDLTFNVQPDPPFARLAQIMGTGVPPGPLGSVRWELSRGLIPHADRLHYLPGFIPREGDRVATIGHWVLDCAHADFHTEIHPPAFAAFAHADGRATVAHAFAVPYFETQLYTPLGEQASQLRNPERLTDPNTLTLPQYLEQEVMRVGHAGPKGPLCCHDRIEIHHLLAANEMPRIAWYVCAPPGTRGRELAVTYDFVVRPGVRMAMVQDPSVGCVRFQATTGRGFTPMDPARRDCALPWRTLDQQARQATGMTDVSLKRVVEGLVSPSFRTNVDRDPITDCYGPLIVEAPIHPGRRITVSSGQPYPFYGVATVAWSRP